jgi:hypothetical protein
MNNNEQILKSRDDRNPIFFSREPDAEATEETFRLAEHSQCSWQKKDEPFNTAKLRERIEPWLTALFQSEHFALLVGSGLSHAVHWIGTSATMRGMNTVTFSEFDTELNTESKRSAAAAGRSAGNIEDQIHH